MKRVALLALVLLVLPIVSAAQIDIYDLEAVIDDDGVTEHAEIFVSYEGESSVTLLLPPELSNLQVSLNSNPIVCTPKNVVGHTEITCPVEATTDYFLDVKFESTYPLVPLTSRELFTQKFESESQVSDFSFRVKLPERAILPEEVDKFVNPTPSQIYSDGRRIVLLYEGTDLTKFDVSIIYEPNRRNDLSTAILVVLGLAFVYSVGVMLLKKTRKKKKKLYLLPDEKEIIRILHKSKDPIRQKDIEDKVDFSKAKLSRVLRGLEERELIRRIPKGNTNLIELRKR